jgi:6-phosphogluconolactonase
MNTRYRDNSIDGKAMNGKVHIYNSLAELATATANRLASNLQLTVQQRGVCNIVLSGGNTPHDVYSLLASTTFRASIDWKRVNIFFGDERCVPPEHPDSNYGMVHKVLLSRLPIGNSNTFRIRAEVDPHQAALEYSDTVHEKFGESAPGADVILLGLGADGHTASIFPGTTALEEKQDPYVAVYVHRLSTWRVTMTFPFINAGSEVLFLVSGRDKSAIVNQVISARVPTKEFPASMVQPEDGNLHWMLDSESASLLDVTLVGTDFERNSS